MEGRVAVGAVGIEEAVGGEEAMGGEEAVGGEEKWDDGKQCVTCVYGCGGDRQWGGKRSLGGSRLARNVVCYLRLPPSLHNNKHLQLLTYFPLSSTRADAWTCRHAAATPPPHFPGTPRPRPPLPPRRPRTWRVGHCVTCLTRWRGSWRSSGAGRGSERTLGWKSGAFAADCIGYKRDLLTQFTSQVECGLSSSGAWRVRVRHTWYDGTESGMRMQVGKTAA